MRAWTDKRVEQVVGILLRAGVILAAAVVLAGGTIHLARHGSAFPDYRVFHGVPAELRHVSGIVTDALRLHGRGLIQLGLLLLIATPVARVAFCVVAFSLQRDRLYVAVTLIVLAALVYGFVGGGP